MGFFVFPTRALPKPRLLLWFEFRRVGSDPQSLPIVTSVDPVLLGQDSRGYAQDKRQIQAQSGDLMTLLEQLWIQ